MSLEPTVPGVASGVTVSTVTTVSLTLELTSSSRVVASVSRGELEVAVSSGSESGETDVTVVAVVPRIVTIYVTVGSWSLSEIVACIVWWWKSWSRAVLPIAIPTTR